MASSPRKEPAEVAQRLIRCLLWKVSWHKDPEPAGLEHPASPAATATRHLIPGRKWTDFVEWEETETCPSSLFKSMIKRHYMIL